MTQVVSGTPADKAGLRKGDAIVAVDGEPVDSGLSLVAQVRERGVGDKAKLTIVRGGQRQDIQVTLASKPSSQDQYAAADSRRSAAAGAPSAG